MVRRKTKLARVPVDVWNEHRKISTKFGFPRTSDAFRFTYGLLRGDFEVTKKRGKKKTWEIKEL